MSVPDTGLYPFNTRSILVQNQSYIMKPVDPKAVTEIAVRADADWLQAHWMPYTGNREFKANPRLMVAADGAY